MTPLRIDPKTRRIIVTDLTPPHRQKKKGVHGVDEILSKEEFDDYKREREEEDEITNLLAEYTATMANEGHSSNRRGFEIR